MSRPKNNPQKKSFILYNDQREIINELTNEQAGNLLKLLYDYTSGFDVPLIEDPAVKIAFLMIKGQIDRDSEKYRQICEKNKENIQKRWNKKDTTVYDRIRTDTKHTDTDTDTDTDTEKKRKEKKEEKLPDWLDKNLWNEYKAHRKNIKAKLTPKAEQLAIKKLQRFHDAGQNIKEIIEESILNGWKGLFERKKGGTNGTYTRHWEPQKNWKEMEIDRAAAEANRLFAEGSKTKEGTHSS